jgi:hypothetical protein
LLGNNKLVTDLTLPVVGLVVITVTWSGNEHEQCGGEVAAQDQSFVREGSGRLVEWVRLVSARVKVQGRRCDIFFFDHHVSQDTSNATHIGYSYSTVRRKR